MRVLELTLFLFFLPIAMGTPIFSPTCGAGSNNIPDATVAGIVTTPGVLSCGFVVNAPGTVASGNAITVGLVGFIHEASGDVIVTLAHYTNASKTAIYGATQTLFHQIGKTSADPNDFGYSAQFGDPSGGGENYMFNTGFATNLWSVASLLGSADFIPGAAAGFVAGYTTNGAFSSTPNNFSAQFAGQPLDGYWELNIVDNGAGPSVPSVAGSLLQFSLDINTALPEPGTWFLCALGLASMALPRTKR